MKVTISLDKKTHEIAKLICKNTGRTLSGLIYSLLIKFIGEKNGTIERR